MRNDDRGVDGGSAEQERMEHHGHRHATYWPKATHVLLLRAATLDAPGAIAAWDAWRARVDIDRLDEASQRLIPLLAHNLKRCGIGNPPLGRYTRLVEHTWASNQRRFAQLAPTLAALTGIGIPVMLLKGMALALHHYDHPGLRPMDDVDLLVPASRAAAAIDWLHAHGWESPFTAGDLDIVHSRPFTSADGRQIDLHWHALQELAGTESDAAPWGRAGQATKHGVVMAVMAPEDLLLQVIVHGARWSAAPPIRWVADAAAILSRAGERFDWTRLMDVAREHALGLPLGHGLEFLHDGIGLPIPGKVLETLRAYRPTRFERVEQRMREWTSPLLGGFPFVVCQHLRHSRHKPAWVQLTRLPGYVQRAYGLPSVSRVPASLWRRAIRRVRLSASPRAS